MKRSPLKRKTPLTAKKRIPAADPEKRIAEAKLKRSSSLRPRSKTNKKRPRNFPYMLWIKTLPCTVCRRPGSEACHTGPRGLGQKSPDEQCIPLCPDHHRHRRDALDVAGPRRFEEIHGLDIKALVSRLNDVWFVVQSAVVDSAVNVVVAKSKEVRYV
jgi:hypothetical protein